MVDDTRVHSARRYNYWLGGKDNFAVDRESGDMIAAAFPGVRITARENRGFLRRAVTHLAAEAGVRQFLDIGTGLPTADNTHEVAQRVAPSSRVVYVDNDPMVLVHARALLTSTPEGRTHYLEADLRTPEKILADPEVLDVLDLDRPVALMLVAVLHFVRDDAEAREIVRTLVDALPSGSYLALSHATTDFTDAEGRARYLSMIDAGQVDAYPRTAADLALILEGLEVLEPGFVAVSEWRPDDDGPRPDAGDVAIYGVLARKP
ncbi:SAM-dependent methyltransferase [Paractinoplanes atraurantiacus]|uniref:S-adenosyl methyltransferase n=1 Tax=Paractinoplanes atraurantiacus TaxID=1036182 RepID=A0A285JNX7_9ACTN|nr:SAM-dependent methyltransferase [Actinoplanes atraurantiacus]SNY61968.1 S-adenosyl methyltransferase [Actinoplanes atraurantiacus]